VIVIVVVVRVKDGELKLFSFLNYFHIFGLRVRSQHNITCNYYKLSYDTVTSHSHTITYHKMM